MAFYSMVPFEGQVWLIKATESVALTPEQLKIVDEHLQSGKTITEIQDVLNDIWTK